MRIVMLFVRASRTLPPPTYGIMSVWDGRARPRSRRAPRHPRKYIVSRQVSKVGSPLTLVASG